MSRHKKRLESLIGERSLVSVIIPNYRRFDLLTKCLASVPAAFGDLPYEVILVDNGSPREELAAFAQNTAMPDHFKLIELPKNIGFPGACNRGVKAATAPLLFFLNSDVVLKPGSGERLVAAMDDPDVGIAGMKLLFPTAQDLTQAGLQHSQVQRPADKIQHVGLFTNLRAQVIHMYLGWSEDNERVNAVREVYAVTGAALMTRRMLFQEVGGFDTAYGMGTYEDCDLAMKVHERRLRVIVETKAVGYHYTGATAERYQAAFPTNANRQIFEQKWYNKLVWTEWVAW